MKRIVYILSGIAFSLSLNAAAQATVPDQNPNWQQSAQKYAEKSDELTSSESTTIHETYEAYDWTEAKEAKKQDRKERRHELRKLKYQSRYRCRPHNRYYYPYQYNQYQYGYPNYGSNWWWLFF